ncbi:hypothetical protein HEL41_024965, partial [Escherichia coli]|nr:hypothetical protein [Escherichia coli]
MISDKSVERRLGKLSRDIAQRTPGTGDFPTAVEGLELFRRNEPAPPVSCLVPPSIVLVADGAKRHCCKVSDEAAFCLIQRP